MRALSRKLFVCFSIFFALISISQAQTCSELFASSYDTPLNFERELLKYSQGAHSQMQQDQTFRLLVWNIYKSKRGQLPHELLTLTQEHDLFIIQEGTSHPVLENIYNQNDGIEWEFATSFTMLNGHKTGVLNGSRFNLFDSRPIVSLPREPVIRTPKMILTNTINIKGYEHPLLIANIHAINFVNFSKYQLHIRQLISAVERHKGPIIVAGDFNNWKDVRTKYLMEQMQALNLKIIDFKNDPRSKKIDHIFIKDLDVVEAAVIESSASDHLALTATLTLNGKK